MGLYFGLSLRDLENYVKRLDQRLNSEENFSDVIASNTRIIYNDSTVIAMRTNIIQADFHHYARWSTCEFFRVAINERKSSLYGRMEMLASDVISGKLTTRVLPISLLHGILANTRLMHGTHLARDPLMIYQMATISLLSVNPEKRRIRILMAIPNIDSEPSHYSVAINSLKSIVKSHGYSQLMELTYPTDLHLPVSEYELTNDFPLSSDKSFESLRKLGGCVRLGKRKICKTDFLAESNDLACIKSLVRNVTSNGACMTRRTTVFEPPTVIAGQGENGLLINCPDSFTVIGHTDERMDRITTHITCSHPDRRICVFAPSKYLRVTVKNSTYEESILQCISTTVIFDASISELASYYKSDITWSAAMPENLTMHSLNEMFYERYFGITGSDLSMEMIGLSTLLLLVVGLGLYILALQRGWLTIGPSPDAESRPGEAFSQSANRESYWQRMRNRTFVSTRAGADDESSAIRLAGIME